MKNKISICNGVFSNDIYPDIVHASRNGTSGCGSVLILNGRVIWSKANRLSELQDFQEILDFLKGWCQAESTAKRNPASTKRSILSTTSVFFRSFDESFD